MINKNHPDKKKLLEELDGLGYSARMKYVAQLGRESTDAAAYSRLLAELLEEGAYEAHLALTGAEATANAAVILEAVRHRAAGVRKRAAGLLAQAASAEEIEGILEQLSQESRRHLLHNLSLGSRHELAERLLLQVNTRWGAKEAAILLPACGRETVSRWLPELGYAIGNWHSLAKRHPDEVAAFFRTSLAAASSREKGNVWRRFSSAMEMLCRLKPEVVLDCALQEGPKDILHPVLRRHLGFLIPAHADAVHTLLIRVEARGDLMKHGVPHSVLKKRRYFTLEQWKSIAALLPEQPEHLAKMLHALAPSKRAGIFEAAYGEETRAARVFPEELLDELPHDLRDKEASRMLGLRQIKDYPLLTVRITARRLIGHAREPLEQEAAASSAEERGQALALLVRSTALSREGMDKTLVFLKRIRNDQDPVRQMVFAELARCPASLFREEHIPELDLLVDSVAEARDTSHATRARAEEMAFGLMGLHAPDPQGALFQFALRTLTKLVKQSGHLTLPSLYRMSLPHGIEERLFETLHPFLAQAAKRENHNLVLQMADWLGKRAYPLVKLQDMLRETTKAKSASTAAQAARYWLAAPRTRDERVAELLNRDKSFITVREVFEHLHRRRQEWLDPYLSGAAVKGKFLSGKTIYLLPAANGFHLWLPRQQLAFRALLERVAVDEKRGLHERAHAVQSMAQLPDHWPELLPKFLNHKEVFMAEAALQALSLTEEPERALPLLLEHLDGDRARIAMYAVPRCAHKVNPQLLAGLLEKLLRREKLKITVRKEAIRLLGLFRLPASMALLQEEFGKPKVHKDVAIAIGYAARQLLEDERSWTMLDTLAASPELDIAISVLKQRPQELPAPYRDRYLTYFLKATAHEELAVAYGAFHALAQWMEGHEEAIAEVAAKALVNLEDSSRWGPAMFSLVEAARDGKVNSRVMEVVRYLAAAPVQEQWNASRERDLPHRQRLASLARELTALPLNVRLTLIPLYQGMTGCLSPYETLQQLVISLHIAAVDWGKAGAVVDGLTQVAQCLGKQPYLFTEVYKQVGQSLYNSKGYWQPEILLAVVDALTQQGEAMALAMALPALKAAGEALEWNAASAGRLRDCRNHPDVMVRTLALDIWTAD